MVDPRTTAAWLSPHRVQRAAAPRRQRSCPSKRSLAISIGRPDEPDAVGEILRRDAFQRACVDLARRFKGVICGRIADHG